MFICREEKEEYENQEQYKSKFEVGKIVLSVQKHAP